jgi:predicted MFS family arabinose efflux permease
MTSTSPLTSTRTSISSSTTATARPPILSRALLLRFVSVVASAVGFYLPLAVVPTFAAAAGSGSAAGIANGALLVATVAGELATPRLIGRVGYRWSLGIGLGLLGAPALVLLVSASLPVIVVVGALRGIGFALTVVAGGALTAALIPAERRGEGLAIVGLVGGIPGLTALPLGIWLADRFGYGPVFVVTAAFPLLALVTVPWLPAREARAGSRHGIVSGLRSGVLMRPAAIFAASAAAAGVVVTYLPLAVSGRAAWLAPAALFAQPTASTLGRWVAGRVGDRRGQGRLLVPGSALAVVGMAAMSMTHSSGSVLLGAVAFGVGFGVLQNATLSLMYARVPEAAYATVSAVWNASYDLGMAVGAIAVGLLIAATGYGPAFLVIAVTMVPALVLAHRESARRSAPGAEPVVTADLAVAAA